MHPGSRDCASRPYSTQGRGRVRGWDSRAAAPAEQHAPSEGEDAVLHVERVGARALAVVGQDALCAVGEPQPEVGDGGGRGVGARGGGHLVVEEPSGAGA